MANGGVIEEACEYSATKDPYLKGLCFKHVRTDCGMEMEGQKKREGLKIWVFICG